MQEAKTYRGGCHCGRVKYEATTALTEVVECNCSLCSKRGALWAFVPAPQFKLLKGEDVLADYQFGKKHLHHLFCPSCGIGSFSRGRAPDGTDTFAINARCLDDVDVSALKRQPFDGRSL
jgi:hypothetical protein